jgi:nitroreductase
MQLKEALKKRKSVKRYMAKKPDWRKIIRAIDAARYSPNAEGNFAMKFILIQDGKTIEKITAATAQEFVGKSKAIVVAISDDSKLERLYKERGKRYSSLQAGAAIQNFLLELTEQKLVTHWVRYFIDDDIKTALDISEDMSIEGVFPIGIETKIKSPAEFKPELDNIIYFEKWGAKEMAPQTRVKLSKS